VELQPRPTGQLHFRLQAQETVPIQLLDTPEVQGVANSQLIGIAPLPAHANAAHALVYFSSELPQPICEQPAAIASNSLDYSKGPLYRRPHQQ
jgi:hypothetical protein